MSFLWFVCCVSVYGHTIWLGLLNIRNMTGIWNPKWLSLFFPWDDLEKDKIILTQENFILSRPKLVSRWIYCQRSSTRYQFTFHKTVKEKILFLTSSSCFFRIQSQTHSAFCHLNQATPKMSVVRRSPSWQVSKSQAQPHVPCPKTELLSFDGQEKKAFDILASLFFVAIWKRDFLFCIHLSYRVIVPLVDFWRTVISLQLPSVFLHSPGDDSFGNWTVMELQIILYLLFPLCTKALSH